MTLRQERFSLLHRIIRLEYDADAAMRLMLCGRLARQWLPEDFRGWGSPVAVLFTTDGWWMRRKPDDSASSHSGATE